MILREHHRAAMAYTHVQELAPGLGPAYGAMCHRLPLLVRGQGLPAAVLFVAGRKARGPHCVLEHLAAQLHDAQLLDQPTVKALLTRCVEADLPQLRDLTHESLRVLVWYKRLAASVLGVPPERAELGE